MFRIKKSVTVSTESLPLYTQYLPHLNVTLTLTHNYIHRSRLSRCIAVLTEKKTFTELNANMSSKLLMDKQCTTEQPIGVQQTVPIRSARHPNESMTFDFPVTCDGIDR